jgi:hypothetical protein
LQASGNAQAEQLRTCEAKNAQLYQVGQEVLNAYEHVGLGSFLSSREPFAQGARVKYDEIAQRYGDQMYAGRFDPAAKAVSPASASGADASAASHTSK